MILMPFPYCEKCHLHWLTFMLTIAWIKPKIWTSCILYHAQRDCLHCICCYGATSKQRGESWSSSNLKQLLVQRDRDYKERNLTKTSTLFCSPKVLPGVMNSRAAWTVAAPKEWKLKILKFVSVSEEQFELRVPGIMRDSSSNSKFTSPGPELNLK